MMSLFTFLSYILFVHYVADFVLQSGYMANNKSQSVKALGLHILVYALTLFIGVSLWGALLHFKLGLGLTIKSISIFTALNAVIHAGVDAITSRINKRMKDQNRIHALFVCIGFDQWVHVVTLLYTLPLLGVSVRH